jgi:hypothetical protein
MASLGTSTSFELGLLIQFTNTVSKHHKFKGLANSWLAKAKEEPCGEGSSLLDEERKKERKSLNN